MTKRRMVSKEAMWKQVCRSFKRGDYKAVAKKTNCVTYAADSRKALKQLPAESIDCIITSPPYGALKNYGSSKQLGFGQDQKNEYIPDLAAILQELYRVARPGAAMWVVLDTLKENGRMIPLPWDVMELSRRAGWHPQEVVVWDKGKTLPWSHAGKFRGVCEFILLLSKNKLARFDIGAARDVNHLSSYWVKYPERFNPEGKAPTDLWHFPIPTQGSWSKKYVRHYCPFPVGLVARMLAITTMPGDVVLDPFSGTGSVAVVASHLGRHGIGIEINPRFVKYFDKEGYKLLKDLANDDLPVGKRSSGHRDLRKSIVKLRVLKYPKTLFAELGRGDRLNGMVQESIRAFILKDIKLLRQSASKKNKLLASMKIEVLVETGTDVRKLERHIKDVIDVPPLSKYEVQADISVINSSKWAQASYVRNLKRNRWYVYKHGRFFNCERVSHSRLVTELASPDSKGSRRYPLTITSTGIQIAPPVSA